ncbi:MAG: hypothetical protein M1839_001427 [Geoglossum umbratile]|nr:MAG: hypothetical protein M1839_001427 [Geoglossum umbratile]
MEEPKFRSYSEYVRHLSLDYPELGWLSDFLSYPGSTPSVTRVRIVDSIGGGLLRTQDFPVSGKPLTEALKDHPGDILTRLVIVSYFQSWNIDRDLINTIGIHFKLDPWFLWGHLDHYYESNDALCKNRRRDFQPKPIEPLPSERASVEIALGSMGVSAVILGPSSTVAIFARDSRPCVSSLSAFSRSKLRPRDLSDLPEYLRDMPSSRFNASLMKLTPEEVLSADKNPIEYICPYAQFLAVEINSRVQQLSDQLEEQFTIAAAGMARTEVLEGAWAVLHDHYLYLSASFKSLSAFAQPGQTCKINLLLEDYRELQQRIEQAQQDLRDYLNRHVSMMSLKESRLGVEASSRAIMQARSVNRLTKLAFVFIPLSFVSSIFGMNFKELGTGQLSIWIFGVTASLLVVLVALIAFAVSRLSNGSQKALRW